MQGKLRYFKPIVLLICNTFLLFPQTQTQEQKVAHSPPQVNFDATNLCYGSVTNFVNTTVSSTPPTYTWTVYEQSVTAPLLTSNLTNISFQFPDKTTYTVQLTANNGHLNTLQHIITMDSTVSASFECGGCGSAFYNLSTCATSYFWDFGDGFTSTLKSPVHPYSTGGYKSVKLIAMNGSIKDSLTGTILTAANTLTGKFTATVGKDSVSFVAADSILASNAEFHWSFGDGTNADFYTIFGRNVRHKYPRTGRDSLYTAFLLVKTLVIMHLEALPYSSTTAL